VPAKVFEDILQFVGEAGKHGGTGRLAEAATRRQLWRGHRSAAGHLRQAIEMRVAGKEQQVVLHSEGRDPNVVHWDRASLQTELSEDTGEMMGRLLIGHQDAHAGRIQKKREGFFILAGEGSAKETGAKFGQNNKGQINASGALDNIQSLLISLAEITSKASLFPSQKSR
jgi:hypothetical protein